MLGWTIEGLRQILKSLLKIHPDATSENDTSLVRENPVTFLKTCFALGVALMFCYLMYTLLLYAHDFVVVKIARLKAPCTSRKLCPSDLLPVIKADGLNLGMKPHRVHRMNEPVEMCLVKNQYRTTPKMLLPPKPVQKQTPSPILPHHASISEAIRSQEENKAAAVASKAEVTSDNLPLVAAVKKESLFSMQIIETKCQDPEKLPLGRHVSEKDVDPGKAVDASTDVCAKIEEKEKEMPKPAQQTQSTSSSLSATTIPTSANTNPNLATSSNPATNFETATSEPSKSSTTSSPNKSTKRLSPRKSTKKKTTLSPEKRKAAGGEARRKYSTSYSDSSSWSQESIDGSMPSDLRKNSHRKKFVTQRRQGAGADEVTVSMKEDRGKDDTSEERSTQELSGTGRGASKPNKDTDGKNPAIALVQMWPSASLQAGCVHCQNQPLYPVTFRWHDTNPTSVFVSGSFVNWESKIPLRRDRYGWVVEIQLPRGHFEYKYIVDRQWAIDEKRQSVVNTREGQINHTESVETEVAIKIQNKDVGSKEADLLKQIKSDYVVKYIGVGENEDYHYLILELYDGPSLQNFLDGKPSIPIEDIRLLVWQCSKGIEVTQSLNIINFDLKPANVLLKSTTLKEGIKIGDFGVSYQTKPGQKLTLQDSIIDLPKEFITTFRYMPPEVLEKENPFASFATDIWSFGVILYEVTFRVKFLKRINKNDRSRFCQELDQFCKVSFEDGTIGLGNIIPKHKLCSSHQDILQGCLKYDYKKRINFEQMPEKDSEGENSEFNVPDVTLGTSSGEKDVGRSDHKRQFDEETSENKEEQKKKPKTDGQQHTE
ncbi:unnamed protein product, partial [Mesorhabditis belari]|uniref:Protein kinase domain-containing protein n=1 Tax=Mesorhabditis belari TaxID=2138241 RepID=A0AAF3EWK2_9BILA